MSVPPFRRKVADLLQWLGLPGVVLFAALLCDLVIVADASLDGFGPRGVDLLLLPGILSLSACALWGRSQPVVAAWVGAAALVGSTVLIRLTGTLPYTALLPNISFAETVAGLELVFFCVRAAKAGIAFATTSAMVVACLLATAGRDSISSRSELVQALVSGFVLLTATVVVAVQLRKPAAQRVRSELMTLLRRQWPLVGVLAAAVFMDIFISASTGVFALVVLATNAGAVVATVQAIKQPVRSALWLAGVMFVCALGLASMGERIAYVSFGGFPLTQVLAGMIVVVFLVRTAVPRQATWSIGLLSLVVACGAVANTIDRDQDSLRALFVSALLLLGISVATGLYFRARDSERTQAVETAVNEAQTAERMALARELHDVVAHHVTGIVVQAQAAKMLGEKDPRVVVDALGQIEHAGTEALVAMRRLVRSMRGDAPSGSSEFSEQATTDLGADLRKLVEAGNHGVPTEIELDLPADLPQEVARSALRIVQESLTNVGKHASDATLATVAVRASGEELHVRVSDNGTKGAAVLPGGGYGLIGMRERVDLLHGRLAAGPGPDGGWLVEVWLPLDGDETQ
ncbi:MULTISPECIES: sensor histidine kinase [Prauserella]|uniref:sensor histidine kinase n=1 Tax=Prauserella TaxID=142577 RepID=UPI001E64C040|nr:MULTISPECIES: sensor histidine kinase [Prauserella]